MEYAFPAAATASSEATAARFAGPIWTLAILAPVIAEVLSGSTRLSFLFVLVPEIMVWGCGALLCRELVRRWQAGGTSLLLLGLALSIAEEFVIQQTSLAPLPFPGANVSYGRAWGVNWLYFLFMLGYESVWVVLVPVEITELIFPARRSQPWLRKRGAVLACAIFAAGSLIAGYAWIYRARPSLHAPAYHPAPTAIAAGVAAMLALAWSAYWLRGAGEEARKHAGGGVSPWLAGTAAFAMTVGWFQLIGLVFTPVRYPVWMPLTAGCAWAALAFVLFLRWSTRHQWGDAQRWSAAFGAVMACMSVGYLSTAGWSRADLTFKAIVNALAAAGLLVLARKVWQRQNAARA
ncbi:MAG: hypothetical protein WBE72_10970 [Terracidiphilus sp.]